MKKTVMFMLGLVISFGALYFLIRGDIETLQNEISGGQYAYVVPALVLFVLALVTRGLRWRVLLGYRISNADAFHAMNVGYMLNNLPLRVGELARAWLTTRLDSPIAFFTSLSSIALERVIDMLMVIFLLGVSLMLLDVPQQWSIIGLVMGTISVVVAVVMFYFAHNREVPHRILTVVVRWVPFLERFNLVDWLDHMLDGLDPLKSPKMIAQAIFWTVISWALSVITGYVLMLVFFDEGSWAGIMLTVVMLSLAIAVPAMPGNLGTFEAAGVGGLWLAGMVASAEAPENAPALAFAVLLHALSLTMYVLLGMIGLWMLGTSLEQVQQGVNQLSEKQQPAEQSG